MGTCALALLILGKPDWVVIGVVGVDLLALPIVIAILVSRSRRKTKGERD